MRSGELLLGSSVSVPRRFIVLRCCFSSYSTTVKNCPGGANNESRVSFCGPGIGFCGPGVGSLVLVDVVACHYIYYH